MSHLPPDHSTREGILTRLDTTLLVEASAGTGKTTSMVGRMIALLEQGKCEVSGLAAVTFTRKAAAELRSRFQARLEQSVSEQIGLERERLATALRGIEGCFVGTIHSFCGRLLRERPIEAGVDPTFQVLEPDVDETLREEAWREYVAALFARRDPLLKNLLELGLEPGQLRDAFDRFAGSTDVQWPATDVDALDAAPAAAALRKYLESVSGLLSVLPSEFKSDKLIQSIQVLARRARHVDWSNRAEVLGLLGGCEELRPGNDGKNPFTIKHWPGETQGEKKDRAEAELLRWNTLATLHVAPALKAWRGMRYRVILELLKAGLEVYDRKRREVAGLSNQDLLFKAAELLRGSAALRSYFQRRFTHLLVDEFQDTDPIQAEVLLLLTSSDVEEPDWSKTRPRPGSLFVVGDPKQSIYRFRRADITTYNRVKEIIVKSGGDIATLTANFRSEKPLLNWVNDSFRRMLGEKATDHQPAYSPLEPGRANGAASDRPRLRRLDIPGELARSEEIADFESRLIARSIAHELAEGARASDFLIVTYNKKKLTAYARALQSLRIPIRITGGSVFSAVEELSLLRSVLRAVSEPHDPVALVAALRGEAFGLCDTALHAFKKHGGIFSYFTKIPEELAEKDPGAHASLTDAFCRLRRHAALIRQLPPVTAFQRIAQDLGLFVRAAAASGGNVQAGSLAKAFEVLRAASRTLHCVSDLVAHLELMLAKDSEVESLPALPDVEPGVRLMNLHKVKGLEAPFVFLADATGRSTRDRAPDLHINRTLGAGEAAMCVRETRDDDSQVEARVLAEPLDWEVQAEEEKKFLEAEEKRLLYVAATRAGQQLTVTFRPKNKSSSYWTPLEDHAQDFEAMPEAKPTPSVHGGRRQLSEQELDSFCAAAASRWKTILLPSFQIIAAKASSVSQYRAPQVNVGDLLGVSGTQPLTEHEGESGGADWGTVVHSLLEAAMKDPGADLPDLARRELGAAELPLVRAEEAVEVVRSVRDSEIWRRALAAERRLTEVPFVYRLLADDAQSTLPTLLRGVIDLVFREKHGWVIVDYKTVAAEQYGTAGLVEHYRGQVAAYCRAWKVLSGEEAVEAGLYFTRSGSYVIV